MKTFVKNKKTRLGWFELNSSELDSDEVYSLSTSLPLPPPKNLFLKRLFFDILSLCHEYSSSYLYYYFIKTDGPNPIKGRSIWFSRRKKRRRSQQGYPSPLSRLPPPFPLSLPSSRPLSSFPPTFFLQNISRRRKFIVGVFIVISHMLFAHLSQ